MTFKMVGVVGLALSLAFVAEIPAAARHLRHGSLPTSMPYASSGPRMIEVRPGLWISSWGCITDEGQGRWKPCDSGGRRSDITLKHDITLLAHLDNGLGFYRFSYNGSSKAYVGVMAQEVQTVMPEAVVRGRDGYLRVYYDRIGLRMQRFEDWVASGARIPATGH
jgi:hypothetical protein